MNKEKDIEVELKFQPTEEQLSSLLEGSEKLPEKNIHDIYFDFPDFRFLKNETRLRFRFVKIKEEEGKPPREPIGFFELKIKLGSKADLEIKDRKKIQEFLIKEIDGFGDYLKTGKDLEEFIAEKRLVPIIEFKTYRKKFKKEGYTIDVDEVDYGPNEEKYKMCEIETMIEDKEKIKETKEKIKEFAKEYNFDTEKKVTPKGWEYLRRFNPEIFREVYLERKNEKNNDINNEIKMK